MDIRMSSFFFVWVMGRVCMDQCVLKHDCQIWGTWQGAVKRRI